MLSLPQVILAARHTVGSISTPPGFLSEEEKKKSVFDGGGYYLLCSDWVAENQQRGSASLDMLKTAIRLVPPAID